MARKGPDKEKPPNKERRKPNEEQRRPNGEHRRKKRPGSSLQIVEVATPGLYRIQATDLLQSIALRRKLQNAIERLKVSTKEFVEKHGDSSGNPQPDAQDLLDALQDIDDATKPIAYGVGEEDPCEG
jgi:ribosomal protein L13E